MKRSPNRLRAAIACALLASLLAPLASAQTKAPAPAPAVAAAAKAPAPYVAPRTPFGQPSLEGIWTSDFLLPLEATPQAPMLTLPEAAAQKMFLAIVAQMKTIPSLTIDPETLPGIEASKGLAIVKGERRTRAVVLPADGKLPLTPEARKGVTAAMMSFGGMDNPEERPNWERCVALFGQPPVTNTGGANPRRVVQTKDNVVIQTEYGDELRIIPFATEFKQPLFPSPLGNSIAHWEGDTLVVETVGLPEKDRYRTFIAVVVPGTSKVIERFTRLSDTELLYQYTVEDPSVYTAPWLAEFSLYNTNAAMHEFSCSAGNYSLPSIMLSQRLADERKAAKAAAPPKP